MICVDCPAGANRRRRLATRECGMVVRHAPLVSGGEVPAPLERAASVRARASDGPVGDAVADVWMPVVAGPAPSALLAVSPSRLPPCASRHSSSWARVLKICSMGVITCDFVLFGQSVPRERSLGSSKLTESRSERRPSSSTSSGEVPGITLECT